MGAGGVEAVGRQVSIFSRSAGHGSMRLEVYGKRLGKFLAISESGPEEKYTKDARAFASGWTERWSDRATHLLGSFWDERFVEAVLKSLEYTGVGRIRLSRGSCLTDFSLRSFLFLFSFSFFPSFPLSIFLFSGCAP